MLAAVGCADVESAERRARTAGPRVEAPADGTPAPAVEDAEGTFDVKGHTPLAGAESVDVLAVGDDGALTKVTNVPVKDGAFDAKLAADQSPTGVFVLKVLGVGDAVLGSGVVNGLPAFVQAFVVDATVDSVTTIKTEIFETTAKGGVAGVQNYLNVIDAYVDAQLANSITVLGVFTTDFNSVIGALSEAVIAAENVIVETLNKAGIPVDVSALQKAQVTAVSGLQGFVTDASGQLVKSSKSFVEALQAASAKAAAPIDKAIFNAVVTGGATFSTTFKQKAPAQERIGFAASKSAFSFESSVAETELLKLDGGAGTKAAWSDFLASVSSAQNLGDLEAAKQRLTDVLAGPKNAKQILAAIVEQLKNALQILNLDQILDALAKIDRSDLPETARLVQKQIVQ
ncbi:MAG: hypothetical protein KIT84_29075 [Labilithrix sp.]|nr:hypothetical protein [Labilithrix sp.]MCW5815114.1 hypothetical protein [Labilithrix sp.]